MFTVLTVIAATSFHFEQAARLMVIKDSCGIAYDGEELRRHLAQGGIADGVTFSDGLDIASRLAVVLQTRIKSTVGEAAFCASVR